MDVIFGYCTGYINVALLSFLFVILETGFSFFGCQRHLRCTHNQHRLAVSTLLQPGRACFFVVIQGDCIRKPYTIMR